MLEGIMESSHLNLKLGGKEHTRNGTSLLKPHSIDKVYLSGFSRVRVNLYLYLEKIY